MERLDFEKRLNRLSLGFVLGGILLAGCNGGSADQTSESQRQERPKIEPAPTQSLPSNVLSDEYVNGTRIVTFKVRAPRILLQVIELCHGEILVTETQRIRSDGNGKYTQHTSIEVHKDSDCHDKEISAQDKRPIPIPIPLQKSPSSGSDSTVPS